MVHKNTARITFSLVFMMLLVLFFFFKKESEKVALNIDENVQVNCPLHSQSCRVNLSHGVNLEVKLSPDGLPAMKPLVLSLKSDQVDFLKVSNFKASFEGRDMEMGHHTMVSNSSSSNLLVAQGLIPLCPMDPTMVWALKIQFEYQNKTTLLTFEVPSNSH
jgi:hypothetical protein